MTPRILLLSGANAAGKTTALKRAQARHIARTDWGFFFPDHDPGDLKGKQDVQFKALMRVWSDRSLVGIALEGTRIYSRVLDCLRLNGYARDVYVAVLNQEPAVVRAHVYARCQKSGKCYRADYWAGRSGAYEGQRRHPTAFQKFQKAHPDIALRLHVQPFWIDKEYTAWSLIHAWIDQVVRG